MLRTPPSENSHWQGRGDSACSWVVAIAGYPHRSLSKRFVSDQLIQQDVAVADESFGLLACPSAQRRISAGEGPGKHHLQRRRDVNDEVWHGDEATEGVDILGARRSRDMNQDVVGGMD